MHLENLAGHKLSFKSKGQPKASEQTAETFVESGASPTEPNASIVRPTLDEAVFYGLAGAITKKLEPCTESHPAGLLLELLLSFGNVIGRSAYTQVDDTCHYTNEFMVKVGESSRSRKGTGKNRIRAIMKLVDPEWLKDRCVSGVGSGEVIKEGGGDIDWTVEVSQLRKAVEFGRQTQRVFMDKPARDYWCRTLYPKLEREIPGLVGAITGRAAAHTQRLALLYALLDLSERIRVEHLKAAAAVWQYCEDSVQAIFRNLLSPEQSQILDFLAAGGPATKTQLIHDCFKRNRKAGQIQHDLDQLKERRRISDKLVDGGTLWSLVPASNSGS